MRSHIVVSGRVRLSFRPSVSHARVAIMKKSTFFRHVTAEQGRILVRPVLNVYYCYSASERVKRTCNYAIDQKRSQSNVKAFVLHQ